MLVVALAAAAAGCGGGGGGERLSRPAYVEQANAICGKAVRERAAVATPAAIADLPAYVDKLLPILDDLLAKLRELRPPRALDVRVGAWLDVLGRERAALDSLKRAAEKRDGSGVSEFSSEAAAADRRARTLAGAIGLTGCANR